MREKDLLWVNVLLVVSLLLAACAATTEVAASPIYKDPEASIGDRVEDLLARMTLAEKIGQITPVEKNSIWEKDITARFIGSLMNQIPLSVIGADTPLFPFGYSLTMQDAE